MEALTNPNHLRERAEEGAILAGKTAGALGKLALMMSDDRTVFKGKLGITKAVAWSDSIAWMRSSSSKTAQAPPSTMYWCQCLPARYAATCLHMAMTPRQRGARYGACQHPPGGTEDRIGNQFALVYLLYPWGSPIRWIRLFAVKRRMDHIKQTPEAEITYQIIAGLGLFPDDSDPLIKEYFASKASAVLDQCTWPSAETVFRRYPAGQNDLLGAAVGFDRHGAEHLQLWRRSHSRGDDRRSSDRGPRSIIDAFGSRV